MKNSDTVRNILSCSVLAVLLPSAALASNIRISQEPILRSTSVPGNVTLALSVEYPTALVNAHKDTIFSSTKEYLGYFDPLKCYKYNESTTISDSYFEPMSVKDEKALSSQCPITEPWDGNFMNWAVTSTIDPFRWVMTGGYRSVDTVDKTLLLRSYDSGQHWSNGRLFPLKTASSTVLTERTGLTASETTSNFTIDVHKQGHQANFKVGNGANKAYYIQVQVCKENLQESNCKEYTHNNRKIWKPEGLIQKYALDLRFSAFGYLNDKNVEAGVLRTPMRFVGPTDEFALTRDNAHKEWDPNTGIFYTNPSPGDATATNTAYTLTGKYAITQSGLINYINKFGQETMQYKADDPVSELYYAVTRYLQNKSKDDAWSNINSIANKRWDNLSRTEKNNFVKEEKIAEFKRLILDTFPIITNWDDPIQLSCQKNSILGIGDIFTQSERKISTDFDLSTSESNARKNTYDKGVENYSPPEFSWIADIAYQNNTKGIRTLANGTTQTAQTYWVDVIQDGVYRLNNQYYRAAKYGGPLDWQSGEKINLYKNGSSTAYSVDRPKNYFLAGDPASMKKGLEDAFQQMSWAAKNLSTTAFAFSNNDLTNNRTYYSVSYDSQYWSANVKAHQIDSNGNIEIDPATNQPKIIWQTKDKLANALQLDYTQRKLLTWSWDATDTPIVFDYDRLSQAQQEALDTSYISGDDGRDFAKWLMGYSSDTRYRSRLDAPDANNQRYFNPLGDIINSKIIASGPPSQPFSEMDNPGYQAFKETHKDRETILYVGANDGMLHGIRTASTTLQADVEAAELAVALAEQAYAQAKLAHQDALNRVEAAGQFSTAAVQARDQLNLARAAANDAADAHAAAQAEVTRRRSEADAANAAFAAAPNDAQAQANAARAQAALTQAENAATATDNALGQAQINLEAAQLAADLATQKAEEVADAEAAAVAAARLEAERDASAADDAERLLGEKRAAAAAARALAAQSSDKSAAGTELFAYMPSSFFLPEAGSPAGTKEAVITRLGKHYYNHRHYVDATVTVADVDFARAGNAGHKDVATATHDWRTILVGGLGAGGYQYYAIDVTNPASFLSASTAPKNLLWEFPRRDQLPQALGGLCTSNCIDIGMTFGMPNIIKTQKYGWVVAVTSGYNNASGKGKLYLLNPKNGDVLETHTTTQASNGLAHTTAFMPLYASMLADAIYGGDINGQVWRFDLTGTTAQQADGFYPAHLLAKLTAPGSATQAQPVTTRPIVQVHPQDRKRYVLIGTGRLLDSSDLDDSLEQSFYALIDGTAARYGSRSTPITRSALGQGGPAAVLSNTATVTDNGWVMDLGLGSAQNKTLSWQNIFSATAYGGNVSFSSVLPVADYCQGTGSSRTYAMDFRQGATILLNAQDVPQAYIEQNFVAFDTQFVRFKGNTQLWTGGGDHQIDTNDRLQLPQEKRGQLSWREIPVTR